MVWFWSFLVYSWLGFLLEAVYALWVGASPDRKCLAVLPLCPVYGLGACAILLLVPRETALLPLFLLGCGTATAAEYTASLFYQRVLGVSFWDYRGLPGSVQGRVCLPFSLAWGLLSIPLVRWLHPALVPWLAAVPATVAWCAAAAAACDGLFSALLLRRSGDPACLRRHTGQEGA